MTATLDVAGWLLIGSGWVVGIVYACRRLWDGIGRMNGLFALGDGTWAIEHLLRGHLGEAAWNAGCAAVCAFAWWVWHRRNRDRRRAMDAIGAKSRAIRDAMVRKVRESARPRPVLRPAPGGVR